MNALNGWLKAVHADGLVLVRTRVAGPWEFAVQPRDAVVFHFVAEGASRSAGATAGRVASCRNGTWMLAAKRRATHASQ